MEIFKYGRDLAITIFKDDPFPGTDYTQYQNWQRVTTPNGQVYYEVPGNPGYVLDPVASNATGRKVFHPNPKDAIAKQKIEQDKLDKAQKQQEFNQSPTGQIIPVVTGTAGTIGSLYAANQLGIIGNGAKAVAPVIATQPAAATAAQAAAQGAAGTIPAAGEAGFIGPVAPGEAAAQGFLSSPIETLGGVTGGELLGGAGAIYGGYNLYNSLQHGGGWQGGAVGGAETGAGIGTMILPGVGTAVGAGAGAIGGAILGSLFSHKTTKQVQEDAIKDLASKSTDPGYLNSVGAAAEESRSGSYLVDKNGVAHNKWEETVSAGADPNNLVNSVGNLQEYGPQWNSLTPAQKLAVTQANINSGIYDPNKGIVEISDSSTAQRNLQNVISGQVAPTTQGQAAAAGVLGKPIAVVGPKVTPAPGINLRSMTRSPGIGLNGQPISYG